MKKILFIDDDETLGKVIQKMLQQEGMQISLQQDETNLDRVISQITPDVIILDYFLPGKNGAEIALSLKTNPKTKNIPIIMISSSYGIQPLVKHIGVNAFLPKPFDVTALIALIQSFTA